MKINKKLILIICVICLVVVSFCTGFFVGKNTKIKKYRNKANIVKFYQNKKENGKELSKSEKQALKYFIIPYEECIRNQLNKQEQAKMIEIQKEITDLSKGNDKISVDIRKLNSTKDEKVLIKKIKKCQKYAYKNMTKENKKEMKKGLKKMNIDDIISLFHGIK